MIKVSPSILSADFVNLERDIRALSPAGADYVHIDVMDGEFVPNITIGIPVVAAIRKITELPLDVHLMIDRPLRYVDEFCKAGADILTIHEEADTPENTRKALEKIRANGVKAALSVKPKTPAEAVLPDSGHDRRAGLRRAVVHGGHDAEGANHPGLDRKRRAGLRARGRRRRERKDRQNLHRRRRERSGCRQRLF